MNRFACGPVMQDVTTFGGLPLHPLVVHAVVVLLPLAALGAVVVALRRSWRQTLGVPVLLVALVGAVAVPVALTSGTELWTAIGGHSPLIDAHARRAEWLQPFTIGFVVLLAAAVFTELSTTRPATGTHATATTTVTRSRVAAALAVLAALLGLVVAGLVAWVGHAGAVAVWQGVGQ